MAKFDRSVAPYYDDYDSSKQYTHLLALPGRVAQAREITQIQSTVKDIVKSIGDSIMKDGNIVEGCQVILNKYHIGEELQYLSSNVDKLALTRLDIIEVISVIQGNTSYSVGSEGVGDCYLLVENGVSYIQWNGTNNHPISSNPYRVTYKYSQSDVSKSATVTAGRVYMNGMVLPVEETTINIRGEYNSSTEYTETIGFKLDEVLITEYEDSSLRDPAIGYENHNQAGCYRVKSTVSIVLDDPDAATLATLVNGEVAVEKYAPEYDVLSQTLATRTKEESGSYIVKGYGIRVEDNPSDQNKVNIVVEPGIAYINGYRRELKASRKIPLDRALESRSITRESATYNGNDFTLSSTGEHVKEILRVVGTIETPIIIMPAPDTNGATQIIPLPDDAVGIVRIVSVTSGSGTVYTDWEDVSDTENYMKIRWKGTENTPKGSYNVVCEYRKLFEQGIDYELVAVDGLHKLHWINSGKSPIMNTFMTINFNLYLARKDIVHINQEGEISVVLGSPDIFGLESLPESNIETLALAHILHSPGSDYNNIEVSNIALTRFTMNDIQNLLNRIRMLEYNQTVTSLQEDTKQRTVSGTRKSIFTDPLIDFSKIDYYYNLTEGTLVDSNLPYYDATIDFNANICYLPILTKTYDLAYISTTGTSTTHRYNRVASLGKVGETVVLSQMNATRAFQVNPYSKFPQLPEISISPAVDTWIEDNFVVVPKSQTSSEVVSTSTRHIESTSVLSGRFAAYTVSTSTSSDTAIGTRVETNTQESVINERAITYIRGREITVEGDNFPANLDNIRCYIEGVQVPIYPTGSTRASTESATSTPSVRANANGTLSAKFTIPNNTFLTGIREIRLETAVPGYEVEGVAYALYQATGTARSIQRTVETITTVLLQRVTTVHSTTFVDPVGQTFVLDKMTLISGIDLYFASAPASNTPVTCDIREVANGTITSTVLGHKTLTADEVRPYISPNASKATRFNFDDPVLLEPNKEYAFVVRSTSTEYRVWIADLGQNDVSTGNPVLSNPYLIGVMMSSSNNSSWTNHQTSDIKFRLISDTYATSSEIIFGAVPVEEAFSRMYLSAETILPEGTNIEWLYSTDKGNDYQPLSLYQIKLFEGMYDSLMIKARLSRSTASNSNVSPLVALDSALVTLSHYEKDGCYLTLDYPGNSYNTVDIILDTYTESGGSLSVYVSPDNGKTLVEATRVTETGATTPLDYNWEERTYRAKVSNNTARCKIIIKLHSSNSYSTPAFARLRSITYTV